MGITVPFKDPKSIQLAVFNKDRKDQLDTTHAVTLGFEPALIDDRRAVFWIEPEHIKWAAKELFGMIEPEGANNGLV